MRLHRPLLCLLFIGTHLSLSAQQADEKPAPKISLQVAADYLALHASGKAPAGTTALEHRLTLRSKPDAPGAWTAAPAPGPDGTYQFDLPLPEWRWAKLEVRALADGKPLATQESSPKTHAFTMLTEERLAALPEPQRGAWQTYMATSIRLAEHEQDTIAAECRQLTQPTSKPGTHASAEFEMASDVTPDWYGTPESLKITDAVLSYQTPTGGWSKAVGYDAGPRSAGMHWTYNADNPWHYCGTLDNRTTTEQIKFLANVHLASKRDDAKAAALRGIEYLLAAQFPNGGWPQVYPVESGYHEAITLNDDAMLHALEVLLLASDAEAPFTFLDDSLRQRAKAAFDKGIACFAACQVKIDGKPTVWCAQHDPLSLEPVAARLKEPPSLSGAESANLLKFLMRKAPVTPATQTMVQGGLDWLAAHRITNLRKIKNDQGKTDYVVDPNSTEVYWARFYDVKTAQPIFAGAQDGIIYNSFHDMAQKNKVAYDYFTTKPGDVIGKESDRWKKRVQKEAKK